MSREQIEQVVVAYFRDQDDVSAVYLFGSQSAGTARSDSDVDLGLLYFKSPKATLLGMPFDHQAKLTELLGLAVDVVVMNTAPVDLVHRILSAQRLLLDKDPSLRVQFEVRSRNQYFDLKPILDLYRKKYA